MREKRKVTEPRMHTRECERRLTHRIQAGGRDHDMWIETCDEEDGEVPPTVLLLAKYVESGDVSTNGTGLV